MSNFKIKIMKKYNITKGDWSNEVIDGQLRVYSNKNCVCVISMPKYTNIDNYETSKKEAISNAKLITAAPDLLEACEFLLDNAKIDALNEVEDINPELHQGIFLAKKAIKKAIT
jgi:hypothetical protein